MNSFLKELNEKTHLLPFFSPSALEVRKKYLVKCFKKEETQYGPQVIVETEDFKTPLPKRFEKSLTIEIIEELNREISKGKVIFMISQGPVGRSTNIIFTEE